MMKRFVPRSPPAEYARRLLALAMYGHCETPYPKYILKRLTENELLKFDTGDNKCVRCENPCKMTQYRYYCDQCKRDAKTQRKRVRTFTITTEERQTIISRLNPVISAIHYNDNEVVTCLCCGFSIDEKESLVTAQGQIRCCSGCFWKMIPENLLYYEI